MTVLHIVTYLSLLVFLSVFLARIIRIATTPVHLRWELYPVPHEKGKFGYGGSRLEETDWWTKKQHKDRLGGLKVMIPEVMLLKGVLDHNRELWLGSYPFHFGLYIIMGNMALTLLAAVLTLAGVPVAASAGGFPSVLYFVINILVWAGSAIGLIGAVRLFFARLVEARLRAYSTASHYFNILLIGAIYATMLLWRITDVRCIDEIIQYYAAAVSFSGPMPEMPLVGYVHIGTALLFFAYFPFTHMTHFLTKYFTYHSVRWEDKPNTPENRMQDSISKCLDQKVTWAAPHIGADGSKTWLAVTASPVPEQEEKK